MLFDSSSKTVFSLRALFFSEWSLQERKPLLRLTVIEKESIEVGEEVGNQSVVETKAKNNSGLAGPDCHLFPAPAPDEESISL